MLVILDCPYVLFLYNVYALSPCDKKMALIILFFFDFLKSFLGFQHVTCGSVLKLVHSQSNHRLHSHDVKYGSGSGQQVGVAKEINSEIANAKW